MQTKKRAKPVKFGVKAKEAEKKVETQAEEPEIVEQAEAEAPQVTAASNPHQNTELVDKLSDVPFETDFGSPSTETAHATKPEAPTPAAPAARLAPPPEPVPFTATSTNPAEPSASEEIEPVDPSQVTEPAPVSTIPPIGRANEPIPFNPHETVFNTPPDAGEKKKNPFLYFLIIALVAFLTGLAFMAGIYYAMPNKNFFAMPSLPSIPALPGMAQVSPTPKPVAAKPTEVPTPSVALADYSVKVLNGSGISGQAAKVKASLAAEGFTVSSTGNAPTSDITKTQVTYKKTVSKAALTKVLDVLKKTYTLEKETELPSAATKESDITIIIGKEPAK